MAVRDESHRLVQLRFKPVWLYADYVRDFCGFFARSSFDDDALAQRIGVIVQELIENAVRHGDEEELELSIECKGGALVVCVTNTTTEDRAERLKKVLDELAAVSPAEAYERALRQAGSPGETGLGLPRVRYEGRVDLELQTCPGRVAIIARGTADAMVSGTKGRCQAGRI